MTRTHNKMSAMNRASLDELLNFYWDYVPQFAELIEPIRQTLSQDSSEWTPTALAIVKRLATFLVGSLRWVNMAPD